MIVTKDRRADALRAVASAAAQEPAVEILVMDDGSSDGTAVAVREAYPTARIERFETSEGYIVRRNQAAELASGEILVSIDDDAEIPAADVVATTVAEFEDPLIGAVAIPYVDLPDKEVRQRAPSPSGVHLVHRFRGTAYATRRELFVGLGGFRTMLYHQAEEADFCLRLLDAGYVVRLGSAEPIRHHAAERPPERGWFYESRNSVLFAWHNVPMPELVLQVAKSSLHQLWLGRGVRRTGLFARGLGAGAAAAVRDRRGRKPVRREAWRLYNRLGKRRTTLDHVRAQIDRLRPPSETGPAA